MGYDTIGRQMTTRELAAIPVMLPHRLLTDTRRPPAVLHDARVEFVDSLLDRTRPRRRGYGLRVPPVVNSDAGAPPALNG